MVSWWKPIDTRTSAVKRRQHIAAGVSPQCVILHEAAAAKRRQQVCEIGSAAAASRLHSWCDPQSPGLRPGLCAIAAPPLSEQTNFEPRNLVKP